MVRQESCIIWSLMYCCWTDAGWRLGRLPPVWMLCVHICLCQDSNAAQTTHTHTVLRVKILNASLNMLASILPNIEHSIYLLVSDSISCVSHGWIGSNSSGKHGCDLIISSSMCLYLVFFSLPFHLICQSISLSNLVSEWLECPSLPPP